MSSSSTLVPSVEHHALHHPPILTVGVPTALVLLEFKDACEDFFGNAKGGISDDVKVTHILPSFKDPILRGWISSDRKHLASLKFSDFMTLLRSKFLSKQWEDELLSQILRDHLCPGQDFLTWATKLQQQNCILRNTTPSSTRKGFANKFLSRLISTCASSLEKRKYQKLPRFKISSTFILFVTTNVEPWKHELVR